MSKIVVVTWGDAHFEQSDRARKKLVNNTAYVTHSAGYLVHRDKKGITIAQSTFDKSPNTFGESLYIPAGMVQRVRHLK